MVDNNNVLWFAMSAPYCKELEAKRLLDKQAIENFVPMHYDIVLKKDGKKRRELTPLIHNLIFVKTTRTIIQEIKKHLKHLQYITKTEKGKNIPIIIPDIQMQQFITVCNTCNEQLIYLKPNEINLKQGTHVRIIGGPFDGVEGVFIKVRGIRNRRVVVVIQGIAAIVTAEIEPDFIEVI